MTKIKIELEFNSYHELVKYTNVFTGVYCEIAHKEQYPMNLKDLVSIHFETLVKEIMKHKDYNPKDIEFINYVVQFIKSKFAEIDKSINDIAHEAKINSFNNSINRLNIIK
jgi:hypothetical protein